MGYFGSGSSTQPGNPAGSNQQVQFNDAGVLAGGATLVWDKTQQRFGVNTPSPNRTLDVRGDSLFYSSNEYASEGINVINTGSNRAGYNLHVGAPGESPSTTTLRGYLRVDPNTSELILGTFDEVDYDHVVMSVYNTYPSANFTSQINVGTGTWTTIDSTSISLNIDGQISFDGNQFTFYGLGTTILILDLVNGKVQLPVLPTSDPADGLNTLWMDLDNGRVLRVGT